MSSHLCSLCRCFGNNERTVCIYNVSVGKEIIQLRYPVVSVVLSLCLVGSSMAANAYLTVTKHYPPNLM